LLDHQKSTACARSMIRRFGDKAKSRNIEPRFLVD
jgi:hypothetical protein